jgi:hypothetical protein
MSGYRQREAETSGADRQMHKKPTAWCDVTQAVMRGMAADNATNLDIGSRIRAGVRNARHDGIRTLMAFFQSGRTNFAMTTGLCNWKKKGDDKM